MSNNQIRLHLASINHPIVGDMGYKNKDYFNNNPLTYEEDSLFLRAYQLTFTHKNTPVTFSAHLPEKFKNYI
ncbi:MAG TPA: hypothetical protein EYG85_07085 [Crocinitomix sp.]|nr:hypothetical protein [Crocinitomix sp.]